MGNLFRVDWEQLFSLSTPLPEIFLRGTLVYLSLVVLLRLVLKRQSGAIEITDLLVVVLIADAAQNAMAGGYTSIPDGILLVMTILFWSFALDWLGYRWPALQRFIRPPALPLVRNGRLLLRNMRHELITEDELMSQIRKQGIESLKEVKVAYMEGDGHITVITYNGRTQPAGGQGGIV